MGSSIPPPIPSAEREQIEPAELRETAVALARMWADGPIQFVRNFDNLIYSIPLETGTAYLRITPAAHRSREQIESELQILRHLAADGISACRPVESRRGESVHTASVGGVIYTACVLTEAPGKSFAEAPPADEPAFFRDTGRCIARLHESLGRFQPPAGSLARRSLVAIRRVRAQGRDGSVGPVQRAPAVARRTAD